MSLFARGALAAALVPAVLAGSAAAATYDQYACRLPGGAPAPADGFAARRSGGPGAAAVDQCSAGGSLDAAVSGSGAAGWHYAPPAGTSIAGVAVRRRVAIPAGSRARYALAGSDDRCDAPGSCGEGVYDLAVPSSSLDFRLECPAGDCGAGARVSIEAVRIRLADDAPPRLAGAPEGGLFGGGPLSGREVATFAATDDGGGVYQTALVVDGTEQARRPVTGGGRVCRVPFTRAAPCPPRATGVAGLDTRRLADGRHNVTLVVYDATGVNRAAYGPVTVTVANGPARVGGHRAGRHGSGPRRPTRPAAKVILVANRDRLRNGDNLTLVARLASMPAGARGRVAFQVLIAGRWRTFARRPLGRDGVVSLHHRFHATFRRLRYRFRAVVAGGHAAVYAPGHSGVVGVVVDD